MRNPLVQKVEDLFREFGLEAKLLGATYDAANFGNAEAVFQTGTLLFFFNRDRSQDFLNLASISAPSVRYAFEDVEIALGWRTVDEVVAQAEPVTIREIIMTAQSHLDELQKAFQGDLNKFAEANMERIDKSGWLPDSGRIH
jgi:hypothetical protein